MSLYTALLEHTDAYGKISPSMKTSAYNELLWSRCFKISITANLTAKFCLK